MSGSLRGQNTLRHMADRALLQGVGTSCGHRPAVSPGRQLYPGQAPTLRHSLAGSIKQLPLMWRTPGAKHAVQQRGTSTSRRARGRRWQHPQALFTGIVQGQGRVTKVHQRQDFRSVAIEFPRASMAGIQIGASVAINGTCLTVTEAHEDRLSFDIIMETLRATNLGTLQIGASVNFERSARVGDEIGGHNVSGHVCSTATVSEVEDSENNRRLTFQVPERWMRYVLPKGFIAVDGISLTVGEVGPDWFAVYLIPETLRVTTLGSRAVGDAVNVEIDSQTQAIVDTVEDVVARYMAEKVPAGVPH